MPDAAALCVFSFNSAGAVDGHVTDSYGGSGVFLGLGSNHFLENGDFSMNVTVLVSGCAFLSNDAGTCFLRAPTGTLAARPLTLCDLLFLFLLKCCMGVTALPEASAGALAMIVLASDFPDSIVAVSVEDTVFTTNTAGCAHNVIAVCLCCAPRCVG